MKTLFLGLLLGAAAYGQTSPFTFYVDPSNGSSPSSKLTPLPSTYQFSDTAAGESSSVVIRVVNSSSGTVTLNTVFVSAAPNSTAATPNFTVTGLSFDVTLAPQAFKDFTVNFTPSTLGPLAAYLQAQTAINAPLIQVSTLQGNGLPGALSLTCNGNVVNANATINFGNVSTSSSSTMPCTLVNNTASTLAVSLSSEVYNSSAFASAALPASVASGGSLSFSIVFEPGSANTFQANLLVGASQSYPLTGVGTASVLGDISSLTVSFFDPTCKCSTPANPATPMPFGQVITGGTASLTVTVQNPSTTIDAVAVSTLQVSGAGFTMSGAPSLPASIAPGQSISFTISFAATGVGVDNGTLTIGTRQFPLQAQTLAPLVSNATMSVDIQPLTSQQQAHLSITVGNAPTTALVGTLTMQFTSAVKGVTSDPAIVFVGPNSQTLNVNVAAGAQAATYNGSSAITFGTGATAGTITFTLQFPESPQFTQAFTIAPTKVQITSITAVRQSPNLVVTVTGYDNTYSTGALSFAFSTTTAGTITINTDATSAFQQYFFGSSNTAGGAFSLQASFPVNGDVTQVSSVVASLTNSAGATTANQPFQ